MSFLRRANMTGPRALQRALPSLAQRFERSQLSRAASFGQFGRNPPPSLALLSSQSDSSMRIRSVPFSQSAFQRQSEPPTASKTNAFVPAVNFDDTEEAFKSKSNFVLMRSLAVFKACSIPVFVNNSEKLLALSHRILGSTLTNAAVRHSFFNHFCAGEDEISIRPTVEYLHRYGIGSILDYAAEADVEEEEDTGDNPDKAGVDSARVYEYTNEAQCDANVAIFEDCIRAVHNVSPDGFAAIKLTALGNPLLLERISTLIMAIRQLFQRFDTDRSGTVTKERFIQVWSEVFTDDPEEMFKRMDADKSDSIEYNEFIKVFDVEDLQSLVSHCREKGVLHSSVLTEEERGLMKQMIARVNKLCALAREKKVRLMIDAEHSYFQPAIDHVVLFLQRDYNKGFPTVFNTYQCYLKDSHFRCQADIERARSEGFVFAAKLVRGAYMVLERRRAEQMGYESPIHETLQDTHANYDKTVSLVLENIDNANVMIASHNQGSITYTIEEMRRRAIDPKTGGIYFGQLLGMADHLTFNLGQSGFNAYKYVPYGPIEEVVPYLIRRAQENSDIMGGVTKERKMFLDELKRRLFK